MISADEAVYYLYKVAGDEPYKETKSHTCVKDFSPSKMLGKQAPIFVKTFKPKEDFPFVLTEIPQLKR